MNQHPPTTFSVGSLIARLQTFPAETPVAFSTQYGEPDDAGAMATISTEAMAPIPGSPAQYLTGAESPSEPGARIVVFIQAVEPTSADPSQPSTTYGELDMSMNHMPPLLGAILEDHDRGPEYALVECVGEDFTCPATERVEGSAGMTDVQITDVLAERGWSVGPTLCPAHAQQGGEVAKV